MHSEKQEGLEANVLPVQEGYLKYLEDKKPEKEKKRTLRIRRTLSTEPSSKEKEKKNEFDEKSSFTIIPHVEALPQDYQFSLKKSGIDLSTATGLNFKVLLQILSFTTQRHFVPKVISEDESKDPIPENPLVRIPTVYIIRAVNSLIDETNPKKIFKPIEGTNRGGHGRVFFATSSLDKNQYAIKKLEHLSPTQVLSNLIEIGITKSLKHPNLVHYCCAYKKKKEIWMVMEYIDGGSLTELINNLVFTDPLIACVIQQVLKGVAYLHERKLAHRDIKSGNLIVNLKGKVKLLDFGLCADMSLGPRKEVVGSPFWIPPEMLKNKNHDCNVDIWQIGVVTLEMLLGGPPNKYNSLKAMYTVGTEGLGSFIQAAWSSELKEFLNLCLKIEPSERTPAALLLEHSFILKADPEENLEIGSKGVFIPNAI